MYSDLINQRNFQSAQFFWDNAEDNRYNAPEPEPELPAELLAKVVVYAHELETTGKCIDLGYTDDEEPMSKNEAYECAYDSVLTDYKLSQGAA